MSLEEFPLSSDERDSLMDLAGMADRLPLEALDGLPLQVTVELGRAQITLGKLRDLSRPGQLIELDRMENEPVNVLVNGKLLARGEIVVIDQRQYGVRITEVVTGESPRSEGGGHP